MEMTNKLNQRTNTYSPRPKIVGLRDKKRFYGGWPHLVVLVSGLLTMMKKKEHYFEEVGKKLDFPLMM